MTKPSRLPPNAGIAIGPILFIIALLGILAAAVAAGSGSFTGGTSQQKAKAMASTVLEIANNIDFCVQRVRGRDNGYDNTQISFQVPAGVYLVADGSDWGQTTPVATCTSDACMVYKPAGGGCALPQIPQDALDETNLLAYLGANCALGKNVGCRDAWIGAAQFQIGGVTSPFYPVLWDIGFTKDICMKINELVGVQNPSGDAPQGAYSYSGGACPSGYDCGFYPDTYIFDSSQSYAANKDFCVWVAGDNVYEYIHVFK